MLSRRFCTVLKWPQFSTVAQPLADSKISKFRCLEHDPTKHNLNHAGQFYKVSPEDSKIFLLGGIPKSFAIQTKTFNETCFMVRKPALDLINCMSNLDYEKPAVRFVVYGKMGSGKSLTVAHVLHWAYKKGFLLVHVPWVGNWMRKCKEMGPSETQPGFTDLNFDAAAWLVHFKSQNEGILSKGDLKTTQDHVWSKRETTPKDSSLVDLVDHGINRIKYASACIKALAEEIKILSKMKKCQTLVAIDGFNAFFHPETRVYAERKEVVPPNKITITEPFLNLTKFDWNNSVIIVTVDELALVEKEDSSHLPR